MAGGGTTLVISPLLALMRDPQSTSDSCLAGVRNPSGIGSQRGLPDGRKQDPASYAPRITGCDMQRVNPVDEFRWQAECLTARYDLNRESPMDSLGQHFESDLCNNWPDSFDLAVNHHEVVHLTISLIQPSVRVDTSQRFIILDEEPIQVRQVNSAVCEFGDWQII